MDSTLGFVIFGISISFYAFVVQSEILDVNDSKSSNAFMVSSPAPPPLPPPPPPPPPPPMAFGSPPPPRSGPSPRHPSPPDQLSDNEPTMRRSPPHPVHHHHSIHLQPPPPPHGMNAGKKVGLLFVGIAAIMQIGIVGFLVFKRRQLLKTNDAYET